MILTSTYTGRTYAGTTLVKCTVYSSPALDLCGFPFPLSCSVQLLKEAPGKLTAAFFQTPPCKS